MHGGDAQNRSPNATVLVVDDDPEILEVIVDLLTDEGFAAATAMSAAEALQAVRTTSPDVVLLDMVMPETTGLDLLAEIRRHGDVPVIFVSGRGGETDRVLGLRLGADDYVVKPFSGPELVARIHSVLRRTGSKSTPEPAAERIRFDGLSIDTATRDVSVDGAMVELTAREFELLAYLAAAPRRVFSREQLLDSVWESSGEWQDPATVTEHVRRIRRKIEADPDNPRWIRTVRGVGYRFEA